MILWIIGWLFMMGLITNRKVVKSWREALSRMVIALVLWPMFLGYVAAELINNKANAAAELIDKSNEKVEAPK